MNDNIQDVVKVSPLEDLDISLLENQQEPNNINIMTEAVNETPSKVPAYLEEIYYWSYLNPRNVNWLDNELIVKIILLWQHSKLRNAAFSEILSGSSVLQVAAVYGQFSRHLVEHIGIDGKLTLIDVAPLQVKNTQTKLAEFKNAEVLLANAATMTEKKHDVVLCYFLLHEVPDYYKTRIIDNLLKHLKPNGKLIFIDYHKPHWAHPLKAIIKLTFDTLEPFAKSLWRKSIREFASEAERYNWQCDTYFGGLYQRVIVQHK